MSRARLLALGAVLTAASLCVYLIEAQFPPLAPIPGVKLGLANIFTLFTCFALNTSMALAVLLLRILLGALLTGQVQALLFSLAGGLLSYFVLLLLHRGTTLRQVWLLSIFCAMAHQVGQILAAALVVGNRGVFWYLPVLLLSAIATGACTGLAAQLVLLRLSSSHFIEERKANRK